MTGYERFEQPGLVRGMNDYEYGRYAAAVGRLRLDACPDYRRTTRSNAWMRGWLAGQIEIAQKRARGSGSKIVARRGTPTNQGRSTP